MDPGLEHSTAQSVCPGFKNWPRITFALRFVYGCGMVQPRRWSSAINLFGNSANAVGWSRNTGYVCRGGDSPGL